MRIELDSSFIFLLQSYKEGNYPEEKMIERIKDQINGHYVLGYAQGQIDQVNEFIKNNQNEES